MNITIPELSLVVLIGPSGSGKSTFARRVFLPTEVISSDFCRGLVSDDENDQSATVEAFEVLHFIAAKRLQAGRLTVVDATNVKPESRKPLIALARQYHCIPVAIVLNIPERTCAERNSSRPDRNFSSHVIRQHVQEMRRSLRRLDREGFRHVHILDSPDAIETATVERQPLWCDRKSDHGPFDIIGDIHGCRVELETLLEKLGYDPATRRHPNGRKVVFLGDLVDRGPDIPGVLRIAMEMVETGNAICVPGNHEMKLLRKLRGRDVQITHGLAESLAQLEREPVDFVEGAAKFIDGLVSHYVLDGGRLVVAHAGMKAAMQGRGSGRVREFALFGETTGETDEFGLPIRYNWAAEYRGNALVVYGHTPVPEAEWLNGTIDIDTGCVFGGKLTALRYPEKELVSVPAARIWCEPARPFLEPGDAASALTAQQLHDDVLDMEDVSGKRIVGTRLYRNVTIREENAAAALEVMSRFAADPKWLIYLPPTMAPADTSDAPGLLEHPAQAFAYYRHEGVPRVICEEKHMGSRAVLIVCRDEDAARRRFGITDGDFGVCYTRTGRRFFDSPQIDREFLSRVRSAMEHARLFEELDTEWLCLDCELMPWSAKAQELITSQYAAVGAAAGLALPEAIVALERAEAGADVKDLLERTQERARLAKLYVDSYRRYCWPVGSVGDLKLAPFHLLASERGVHVDKDHGWHLAMLAKLCDGGDPILLATPYLTVDLTDPNSEADGVRWWERLTSRGGEGMVVKPMEFLARGRRGLVQPALKCRGKEYLRIIYGPEYTVPENLCRLRSRGLSVKRSLALREFALGIEGLERFVRNEPLRRIHECAFGVLALESEPVDPRL
ncbi:MAG TPA: polynucleotide kinase-phosphatase [Candidatus Binataceae bacterium]|nr:polynucleotide kinase-phosphatase [Candidatus Binataceae bacterium]